MATTNKPEKSILQLKVVAGTLASGSPKYQSHNFNLSITAMDDDVRQIADQLAELFQPTITKIARQNTSELLNA